MFYQIVLAENKNDFFRFFCTQSTWERDSNETMIDTACETVVWYERIVFVVKKLILCLISSRTQTHRTCIQAATSDVAHEPTAIVDHLWVEGFSYTFLNLWSHIESDAHHRLTVPPLTCAIRPTQARANGKYVVSCRSSSSSPTLLRNNAFAVLRSPMRWFGLCRLSCREKAQSLLLRLIA